MPLPFPFQSSDKFVRSAREESHLPCQLLRHLRLPGGQYNGLNSLISPLLKGENFLVGMSPHDDRIHPGYEFRIGEAELGSLLIFFPLEPSDIPVCTVDNSICLGCAFNDLITYKNQIIR